MPLAGVHALRLRDRNLGQVRPLQSRSGGQRPQRYRQQSLDRDEGPSGWDSNHRRGRGAFGHGRPIAEPSGRRHDDRMRHRRPAGSRAPGAQEPDLQGLRRHRPSGRGLFPVPLGVDAVSALSRLGPGCLGLALGDSRIHLSPVAHSRAAGDRRLALEYLGCGLSQRRLRDPGRRPQGGRGRGAARRRRGDADGSAACLHRARERQAERKEKVHGVVSAVPERGRRQDRHLADADAQTRRKLRSVRQPTTS